MITRCAHKENLGSAEKGVWQEDNARFSETALWGNNGNEFFFISTFKGIPQIRHANVFYNYQIPLVPFPNCLICLICISTILLPYCHL